jgi:hypothetical protein
MKKETIDSLKKLKLGEILPSYKPLSEEEKELQNTLSKLKNFGILILNKNSYSVLNFKLLSKFIELQDFEKLAEYIENPNELENGIKSSLEYKILKHLKKNDNGEYIDMSEFNSNLKLLRNKLSSLAKKPEKYISIDLGTSVWFGDGSKFERDCILAKIEFNGIKYLNELENTEKSIVNNGILIQDSRLEKSPIKQNINPAPKNNPEKKSLFKRIYSDPWVIGISLIIIAAILGAERIKHWIDSYINGL